MKKLATIFLLLTASFAVGQEEDRTIRWGLNIDARTTPFWYLYYQSGSPISLFVTASSKKHQFDFGPQFYLNSFNFGHRVGIGLQYRYYPNGNTNRFNSYLTPSIFYTNDKDQREGNYNGNYAIRTSKSNLGSIGGGYGIELKLSRKLYIASDVRILYSYGRYKYSEEYPDVPTENTEINYALNSFDFVLGINLGVRF